MKLNNPENFMPDVDEMMEPVSKIGEGAEKTLKEGMGKVEQTANQMVEQGAKTAMGAMDRMGAANKKMMGMMDNFLSGENEETKSDIVEKDKAIQTAGTVNESGGEKYDQNYDSGYGNEAPAATDNMYANMSDEEREKWNSLTPEQQEQAVNAYNNLPPEKQEEIANMTPDERKAALMEQENGNQKSEQSDEWQVEETGETTGSGADSVESTEGRQTTTGTGAAQKGGSRG